LESNTYLSWDKYYESPEIMVFSGDIILVKTSSIGKITIIPNNVPEMTLNPQLVVLKNIELNSKFLYYQMVSSEFQHNFRLETTGGVTPTISQEKINNFCLTSPPFPEQEQIISFLDHKTQKIDDLIEKTAQKVELLKEKRLALVGNVIMDSNIQRIRLNHVVDNICRPICRKNKNVYCPLGLYNWGRGIFRKQKEVIVLAFLKECISS